MMPRHKQIKKTLFSPQFLMFVLIGIINSLNCIIISALFSMIFSPNVSFVSGYVASLFIGYILNSKVNFHKKPEVKVFLKYAHIMAGRRTVWKSKIIRSRGWN